MGRLKSSSDIIGTHELKTVGLYKALVVEFIGTFILVFFGCASSLGEKTDVVKSSLTFGFTLACLMQAFYHLSGCYVNPSITMGMMVARYISLTRTLTYIVAQTLGGIAGAGILYTLTPVSKRYGMGVTQISSDVTLGQAFGVELICTFVLVLTFFATTDKRRADLKGSISQSINLASAATHLVGIPYTGGSFNPARSFGPALVVGGDAWNHHWVYWMAPLIGGMIAGLLYSHILSPTKPHSPDITTSNQAETGNNKNDTPLKALH